MSREILFRGRTKSGNWVEGDLIHGKYFTAINTKEPELIPSQMIEVDPSTVCQYTGLEDKNGKRIFENDILKVTISGCYPIPYHEIVREVVLWNDHDKCFCMREEDSETLVPFFECILDDVEIIGNYFDNPELLEGGTGEDDQR